ALSQNLRVSGVDRKRQALKPTVEVVRGSRKAIDRSTTTSLEHVVHCRDHQPVVTDVVTEDGARACSGQLGDLVDRGVEASTGDNLHRGSPDARPCELPL